MSNPKHEVNGAKYGRCPECHRALWPDGQCSLPQHTAKKVEDAPLAEVLPLRHNAKPEPESGETMEDTMTVDRETGEIPEPAPGQMEMTGHPAFVKPIPRTKVPMVKVSFGGSVDITQSAFRAMLDGQELVPGRVAYVKVPVYMPNPHTKWVKRTEGSGDDKWTHWENEGQVALKVTGLDALEVTEELWDPADE